MDERYKVSRSLNEDVTFHYVRVTHGTDWQVARVEISNVLTATTDGPVPSLIMKVTPTGTHQGKREECSHEWISDAIACLREAGYEIEKFDERFPSIEKPAPIYISKGEGSLDVPSTEVVLRLLADEELLDAHDVNEIITELQSLNKFGVVPLHDKRASANTPFVGQSSANPTAVTSITAMPAGAIISTTPIVK